MDKLTLHMTGEGDYEPATATLPGETEAAITFGGHTEDEFCEEVVRRYNSAPDLLAALKTAKMHLEHMAAFITSRRTGYSFEGLSEDMPTIDAAIEQASAITEKRPVDEIRAAWREQ